MKKSQITMGPDSTMDSVLTLQMSERNEEVSLSHSTLGVSLARYEDLSQEFHPNNNAIPFKMDDLSELLDRINMSSLESGNQFALENVSTEGKDSIQLLRDSEKNDDSWTLTFWTPEAFIEINGVHLEPLRLFVRAVSYMELLKNQKDQEKS
jgi:hypothetical protein